MFNKAVKTYGYITTTKIKGPVYCMSQLKKNLRHDIKPIKFTQPNLALKRSKSIFHRLAYASNMGAQPIANYKQQQKHKK